MNWINKDKDKEDDWKTPHTHTINNNNDCLDIGYVLLYVNKIKCFLVCKQGCKKAGFFFKNQGRWFFWLFLKKAGLDLRSNKRSNSNFDCRNGFLGVDYICLDTSHGKIENFSKIVRGVQPPSRGGRTPNFFYESKDNHEWGLYAKFQTSSSKTVDL